MSNAKEASEAEALGTKVLNLCRKKASEKDLLTVLEVRVCDEILNSFSLSREREFKMFVSFSLLCNVVLTRIKQLVLVSFVLFVLVFESAIHRSRGTKRISS
jgi:hypothetical protein